MSTDDTPAEAALRAEVSSWMADHAARFGPSDRHIRMIDTVEAAAAARAWQRELDEGGWGAPTWPHELGGRGMSANEARIFREEQARYATPTGLFHVAILMVGPTLMAHGTPDQQKRHVPTIRRGDQIDSTRPTRTPRSSRFSTSWTWAISTSPAATGPPTSAP